MRRILTVGVWLLFSGVALAQEPAVGTSSLGWTQNDADAPTLTYLLGVNGATPTPITGAVTCTPTNGQIHDCRVSVLDLGLTTGQYTLTVQARRIVENVNFDSAESSPGLNIVRAELANTPTTLVIVVEVP